MLTGKMKVAVEFRLSITITHLLPCKTSHYIFGNIITMFHLFELILLATHRN
jgi:hypothetical protein